MSIRRVAITGLGVLSPLGNTTTDVFSNAMSAKSGVRRLTAPFADLLTARIAAEVDFDMAGYFSKRKATLDRTSQMAVAAAAQAMADSGLLLSEEGKKRAGVFIGTGMGGAHSVDEVSIALFRENKPRVSPLSIVKIMNNAAASHVSITFGLAGPCLTYSTACSSSSVSIGEAFRQIKYGLVDFVLAGGTESLLTYGSFKCWESLGVLAREDSENLAASCRPFSKDRSGFVLGEGAAIVVLEEMEMAKRRGAKIYGEIIGYGSTSDAYHITGPSVEGQERSMRMALDEAGVGTESVDYINAHGTATAANDLIETHAIKKLFGERSYEIPVSSTKSMHGHLMGAGGAVEFVISMLAIKNKAIPPTANLTIPDPECDLDYVPNEGRTGQNVRIIMSNSFAFGGTNAVLVAREV
jgi:3-oxoacyl-[acyl-carrier-protein] synthase II